MPDTYTKSRLEIAAELTIAALNIANTHRSTEQLVEMYHAFYKELTACANTPFDKL